MGDSAPAAAAAAAALRMLIAPPPKLRAILSHHLSLLTLTLRNNTTAAQQCAAGSDRLSRAGRGSRGGVLAALVAAEAVVPAPAKRSGLAIMINTVSM